MLSLVREVIGFPFLFNRNILYFNTLFQKVLVAFYCYWKTLWYFVFIYTSKYMVDFHLLIVNFKVNGFNFTRCSHTFATKLAFYGMAMVDPQVEFWTEAYKFYYIFTWKLTWLREISIFCEMEALHARKLSFQRQLLKPNIHPNPLKLNSVEYFHKRNIFCYWLF